MYIALQDIKKDPNFNKNYNVQVEKIGDIFADNDEDDQIHDPISSFLSNNLNKVNVLQRYNTKVP
jgi:hypothetical protein